MNGASPWDTGRPQPAIRELAEAQAFGRRFLDVGCGTGEHTLLAAGSGCEATGIDVDDSALQIARIKAKQRRLPARFLRHDALRVAELDERFDTVLDSLHFHALKPADRAAYLDGVRSVLRPNGRLFVLGYRDEQAPDVRVPHGLLRADLESSLGDGWRLDALKPTVTEANPYPQGVAAWLAVATRVPYAADGRVATDRARRYLVQLRDHVRHVGAEVVEDSDSHSVIDFGSARCVLHAGADSLEVTVEAEERAEFQRLQRALSDRLEQIGRRDGLAVLW